MPSHKNQIKMLALLSHKYDTDNIAILTFQASRRVYLLHPRYSSLPKIIISAFTDPYICSHSHPFICQKVALNSFQSGFKVNLFYDSFALVKIRTQRLS